MRISCMGCGYAGIGTWTCLADMCNEVTCFDVDKWEINKFKRGTYYE